MLLSFLAITFGSSMGWILYDKRGLKYDCRGGGIEERAQNRGKRLIVRRQTSKFSKRYQTANNLLFSLFPFFFPPPTRLSFLLVTFTATERSQKTITQQNKIRPKLTPSLFCNFYRFQQDVTTRLICFKGSKKKRKKEYILSFFLFFFSREHFLLHFYDEVKSS